MTLPSSGLFVNAFPVTCGGSHTFTRLELPTRDIRAARRALEAETGSPVWVSGDAAWVNGEVSGGEIVEFACEARLDLHHFATREALRSAAIAKGMETWSSFGQVNCADKANAVAVDPILIDPVLHLRVGSEGVTVAPTAVVARADSRWRFAGNLLDPALQALAVGETAMRTSEGPGPRRARVTAVTDECLTLALRGGEEVAVAPADYTLAARAPTVREYVLQTRGNLASMAMLRELRIRGGSLDSSGRINRYVVKEREGRTSALLDRLGREITFADGVVATLANVPLEIYVEA